MSGTNPYRRGPPVPRLPWRPGPKLTVVLFFGAGTVVPAGCLSSCIAGPVDTGVSLASLTLTIACLFGAPALLPFVARRRLGAFGFCTGVCAAVVACAFGRVRAADWYYVSRCRDGDARTCVEQAMPQGSGRRGCASGSLSACEVQFQWDKERDAETCAAVTRLCTTDQRLGQGSKAAACHMADQRCRPP
jgi:hypothetical protein